MPRWVSVGEFGSLRAGRGRVVTAEGARLALFREGDVVRAVDDSCPHQGASLGEGSVFQGNVICPWHSWAFDLETGACPNAPSIRVRSYPVRVVEGRIEVDLDGTAGEETTA